MMRVMGGSREGGSRTRSPRLALRIVCLAAGSLAALAAACATPLPGRPGGPTPGGPTATTTPDIPPTTMFGTPPPPGRFVGVGDDGVLATVDRGSGERVAELARSGAPGLGGTIAGVTVSPDGGTAWFDTRHPGGAGRIYQVPTDGSAPPIQVATGTFPEVDPAGQRLAFVADGAVAVHGIVTDEAQRWPVTGRVTGLAWTTDGTGLLWVRDGTELVWLDRDAGAEPRVVATAAAGETFRLPLGALRDGGAATVLATTGPRDTTPEVLVVTLDGGVVDRRPDTLGVALDRSYDATASWGIRTTVSRTVRWSGAGGVVTAATGYVAADW
jgi:hypothetical protein